MVVATFGDLEWCELGQERAIPSAASQAPVISTHRKTLAEARNAALDDVDTEWVIHLDADDELEPGYVEALADGIADMRAPAVRYVRSGRNRRAPYVPRVAGHHHDCEADCLRHGNWLVIGTAVRTQDVRDAGGWRDWPVYEDWDLFQRMWLRGATVEALPKAIYRAHVRPDSRNRGPSMEEKNAVHRQIVSANLGQWAA